MKFLTLFIPLVLFPMASYGQSKDDVIEACEVLGNAGSSLLLYHMLTSDTEFEKNLEMVKTVVRGRPRLAQQVFNSYDSSMLKWIKTYEKVKDPSIARAESKRFYFLVYNECLKLEN